MIEESKVIYELECMECGQKYEVLATHTELANLLLDPSTRSECCSAPLVRVWKFAKGIFNGRGFTTRSTK